MLQEKSCCPLHVAARAGQASQVELLILYGADPGAFDFQGNTPAHYARYVLKDGATVIRKKHIVHT